VRYALLFLFALVGCSDDANDLGIGAECDPADTEACIHDYEDEPDLTCLDDFNGGYCGQEGCADDADCATGSICVDWEGSTYCFLECTDKAQCNENRSEDNESNCSSNVDPVDGGTAKVCVPPSSGE